MRLKPGSIKIESGIFVSMHLQTSHTVALDPEKINIFDKDTEQAIVN